MSNLSKYSDEDMLELVSSDIEKELKDRGYEYGWYKKVHYAGVIYILVNPAFPSLVKIGYADNIEKRIKVLNSNSGLPDPYHCYAVYKVKKRLEDLKLHELIDMLDPDLRHAKNREFYEITKEKAYDILSAIAQINGDEELLLINPLKDEYFEKENDKPKTITSSKNNGELQGREKLKECFLRYLAKYTNKEIIEKINKSELGKRKNKLCSETKCWDKKYDTSVKELQDKNGNKLFIFTNYSHEDIDRTCKIMEKIFNN